MSIEDCVKSEIRAQHFTYGRCSCRVHKYLTIAIAWYGYGDCRNCGEECIASTEEDWFTNNSSTGFVRGD